MTRKTDEWNQGYTEIFPLSIGSEFNYLRSNQVLARSRISSWLSSTRRVLPFSRMTRDSPWSRPWLSSTIRMRNTLTVISWFSWPVVLLSARVRRIS